MSKGRIIEKHSIYGTKLHLHFDWRYGHGAYGLEDAQIHEQAISAGITLARRRGSMQLGGGHSVLSQECSCGRNVCRAPAVCFNAGGGGAATGATGGSGTSAGSHNAASANQLTF